MVAEIIGCPSTVSVDRVGHAPAASTADHQAPPVLSAPPDDSHWDLSSGKHLP